MVDRPGEVFLLDNLAENQRGQETALTGKEVRLLESRPVWPRDLNPLPAARVVEYIARHVGARPRERDAVDERIISNLLQRQGRIIDSQDEVGGYPVVQPVTRKLKIPDSQIEAWLARLAEELE